MTHPDPKKSFLYAARLVSLITLASRILGLVRDGVLAACFGASRISDIFWFAFELPNFFRRVLGEGALSAFIVPIFTKVRTEQGDTSAWRLASNALTVLSMITLVLTALGIIFAQPLFLIYGYGYSHRGDTDAIIIGAQLTRIMFPFLMLLTLSSILMGLCHSIRHFSTPALGSIMLNLAMIVAGFIFIRCPEQQIAQILAVAVLAGGLLRLLIMIPPLIKAGFRFRPIFEPACPQMRQLFLMLLPATFGLAIVQINISISRIFAGLLGEGYNTALIYSNRLVQLPLAIIASALATAILPHLSQLWIEKQTEQLQNLARFAFRLVFIVFVPATVGLMVLGLPIINILFQRNQWDQTATLWTYQALLFYAPGLTLWGLLRIIIPIYYAQQNVRTPVMAATCAMIVNVVLNIALIKISYLRTNLGHTGLALASTIGVLVNTVILLLILRKKGLNLWNLDLTFTALRTGIAAVVMGVVAWFCWNFLGATAMEKSKFFALAWLLTTIAIAAVTYLLAALALGIPDLKSSLKIIFKKTSTPINTDGI
ncbi:MAG: murein biosynthesis integral membrane protein MurJ [Planctomycetes bacterium]|nr:murein biosynthesis integral membrane protein MurJ [Planctomycetota bacterium]